MIERRFGILIANSRFPKAPGLEDLRYPENDVDGLYETLVSKDRGGFHDLVAFKNRPRSEILHKLNLIFTSADMNDLILIYYSGHGKLNRVGRLHLATADTELGALEATAISMGAIRELVDISATNKVVIILDCCYSGAAGDEFLRSSVDDQLQLAAKGRGTYIMTASTGIQVAAEKEVDQHGIFTKHLIQGIDSGDADLDHNGHISMDELYRYVHARVLTESSQEPMKWDLNVRGDLIIARSGKTPRRERNQQLRAIIFDLAKEGLPDDILDKAREIIDLEPEQITGALQAYDHLLDQLRDQSIRPFEFISAWYQVSSTVGNAVPAFVHPQPKSDVSPAKPEQPQKPSRPKIYLIVYAILALVIVSAVLFYYWKPKEDWADKFEKIAVQLEQHTRKAAEASSLSRLEQIIQTRNGLFRQWEGLQREAETRRVDMAPWRERLGIIEQNWQKVVATKQRELTASVEAPKKITDALGMKFVHIPAGTFTMGSPVDEPGRDDDEQQHQVTLTQGFYMQTTEVTQGQWRTVMAINPSYFQNCGENCPVENVSWNDIQKFIARLNEKEAGKRYRLPTEAEWEYAARAGSTTAFANGGITELKCGRDPNLDAMGWYCGNSDDKTQPVAQKDPNSWGLYDMHGNVLEWCQDWYGKYTSGPITDPKGPTKDSYQVLRGGSCFNDAKCCRSAYREIIEPGYRGGNYGFRLVLLPGQ